MSELVDHLGRPLAKPRTDDVIEAEVKGLLGGLIKEQAVPSAVMGIRVDTFQWMVKHVFGFDLVRCAMQDPEERRKDGFYEAMASAPRRVNVACAEVLSLYDALYGHEAPTAVVSFDPASGPDVQLTRAIARDGSELAAIVVPELPAFVRCTCHADSRDPKCPVGAMVGTHPIGATALRSEGVDDGD